MAGNRFFTEANLAEYVDEIIGSQVESTRTTKENIDKAAAGIVDEIIGSQVESTRTTKENIDKAAVEIVDEIIGSQVESTKTIIDELRSIARRKFFAGKTVWFVVLMTILAIGFGFLVFKVTGLPMFQNPELDQITGVATGKMARENWTYVLSPILGFAFWIYFIYMTDLGLPKHSN